MRPRELLTSESLNLLSPHLRDRARVLEVGCGRGELALRLAGQGHQVTALDRDLSARAGAPAGAVRFLEGDFLRFEGGPFDAVLFTRSLHHLRPLGEAVARAKALLAPGGVVVAEEFDVEAANAPTCRWFYELVDALAGEGLLPAQERAGLPALERWRKEHEADPVHSGRAMREALIAAGLPVRLEERLEYLYRYPAGLLPDTDAGGLEAVRFLNAELEELEQGTLAPVGLLLVAG